MARTKQTGAAPSTSTSSRSSGDVKMAKRHTEFIEADVEASQAAEAEQKTTGPNPHPPKTARWSAFENRKREEKGLPPTNAVNE